MKEANMKRLHTCMIPTWHFWKSYNHGDGKKISGCQGLGRRRGWIGRAQMIFRAVKLLSMYMDVIIHLSEQRGYTTPRVNPNVNYGLWVIMMCQCRLITCNKCTTLMGWGGVEIHVWRWDNEKYLYFLLNFTMNPNCSKEIKSTRKKKYKANCF